MLFFDVKSPAEARRLLNRPGPPPEVEPLPLLDALGRVPANEIASPIDLPEFDRSVVDGFAVRAADTFGASSGLPALVRVIGEIAMGQGTDLALGVGEAARIATGGMLPAGADAVVMIEYTDAVDEETVEITRPVAPGENLVHRGDDVRTGALLLPPGRRLRAQDLGALAGVGITTVPVYGRPRVAVIPTGDEIVPPEAQPAPGQVRDINTTALMAAVRECGGDPAAWPIVRDDPEALRATVAEALDRTELVLIAGGSSVGTRDWTLEVLLAFPGAELLFHGVAVRPGKPVIAVAIGERLVLGLPGNPVSALLVFHQFVRAVIDRLAGAGDDKVTGWQGGKVTGAPRRSEASGPLGERKDLQVHGGEDSERSPCHPVTLSPCHPAVPARLATSYASDPGKEDHVRVRLRQTPDGLVAEPVLGKSALITPLVQADGLLVIPEGIEGLEAGELVMVEIL